MYYVYVHTVPNGKLYIGYTKDPSIRWNNGEGYILNRPFYKDICSYGWSNIKHEIIAQFDDKEPAEKLEAVLIALLKTENDSYGYNNTTIYSDAMKRYAARIPSTGISFEEPIAEDKFFETSNLPISVCNELINQWVFSEKNRNICKRRLIDGIQYNQLSKEFGISVRQAKYIVYDCCDKIKKHF